MVLRWIPETFDHATLIIIIGLMGIVGGLLVLSVEAAASSPLDDFEWITPITHPIVRGVMDQSTLRTDDATGDIYSICFNNTVDSNTHIVSWYRYDPLYMGFECRGTRTITTYNGLLDYSIYQNTCYFFSTGPNYNRLRIMVDAKTAPLLDIPAHSTSYLTYLGMFNGSFLVEMVRYTSPGYDCFLYSVNASSFEWLERLLFHYEESSLIDRGSLVKDGTYYNVKVRSVGGGATGIVWTHDIQRNVTRGPITLFDLADTQDRSFYANFEYNVDSMGDFHFFFVNYGTLMRCSSDGTERARVSLKPIPYADNRWLWGYVVMNQSDCVYVIGAHRLNDTYGPAGAISATIDREYSLIPLIKVVPMRGYLEDVDHVPVCTPSDRIYVLIHTNWPDHMESQLTYQIPWTPDLTIDPASYRFVEDESKTRPISISFDVLNVGRVSAEKYDIAISFRLANSTKYSSLALLASKDSLASSGKAWFELSTRLPRGTNYLRLEVVNVVPFENVRTNNTLEVLAYVQGNSPPELSVASPANGTSILTEATTSGMTSDIDGDAVTVFVAGPPGFDLNVSTSGEWSATLDFSSTPSGEYWLTFVAFDGMEYSATHHRLVYIDRPSESLILVSAWPLGDIELLVGEEQVFLIDVKERFSRALVYNWTVNGTPVGTDGSHYVFSALGAGEATVAVEVSSAIASLIHSWHIHARAVATPSLVSLRPGPQPSIQRGASLEFAVDLRNPDGVPCSLMWTYDGALLTGLSGASYGRRFTDGGHHRVSALLSWEDGQMEVAWEVTVLNSPPRISSWAPNGSIRILSDTVLSFRVSAMDPDGDALTYQWEAVNLTIAPSDTSTLNASCTYVPSLNRTVRVIVSDGEESVSMVWDVLSPPKDAPAPVGPSRSAPDLTWVMLAIVVAIATAVSIGYYLGSKHRR